jgi:hypothetical protein
LPHWHSLWVHVRKAAVSNLQALPLLAILQAVALVAVQVAAAAARCISRSARRGRGIRVPKSAFKLWRRSVDGAPRFKKLPWRKLTKALKREWAAMDKANKEAGITKSKL